MPSWCNYADASMLFTFIHTYYCTELYHCILILQCFFLIYSPDALFHYLLKYIHRRTIINMFLHNNNIP